MKNSIYKGYISSRAIQGLKIPQRIQNLVIRTYVEKNNKKFSLSATEYVMENCFMVLNALLKELENYEGLAFYSLHMLPAKKEERFRVYSECLVNEVQIHFALEELVIRTQKDIQLIEDIILVKELTQSPVNFAGLMDLICR